MYSPQEKKTIKKKVLQYIRQGESVYSMTKDNKNQIVSENTLYKWLNKDKQFRERYTRARAAQALFSVEKIDNAILEVKNKTGLTREDIDILRIEVDAIKWYAAKLAPKIYGTNADIGAINIKIEQISGMKIVDEAKFIDVTPKVKELPPDPENKSK